jgi:hypothetical protein
MVRRWLAKADPFLGWPARVAGQAGLSRCSGQPKTTFFSGGPGPALADLGGLNLPGSRLWPVRLVKIDFMEIWALHNFNNFSIVSLLVVRLAYDSNKHDMSLDENHRLLPFSFLRVINLSYLSLTWHWIPIKLQNSSKDVRSLIVGHQPSKTHTGA